MTVCYERNCKRLDLLLLNLQRSLAIVQWYSSFFLFIIKIKFEGDLPPLYIINKCSLGVKLLVWYKKKYFFCICLSLNPFNNTLSCQSNSLTLYILQAWWFHSKLPEGEWAVLVSFYGFIICWHLHVYNITTAGHHTHTIQ